jgi:hypothetical protein
LISSLQLVYPLLLLRLISRVSLYAQNCAQRTIRITFKIYFNKRFRPRSNISIPYTSFNAIFDSLTVALKVKLIFPCSFFIKRVLNIIIPFVVEYILKIVQYMHNKMFPWRPFWELMLIHIIPPTIPLYLTFHSYSQLRDDILY